jgi:hypothetical protein
MIWEAVFLLVILKIPIVYLCSVVYWAIKAEPAPPGSEQPVRVAADLDPRPGWSRRRVGRRGLRGGPPPGPRRAHARRAASAFSRASAER